MLCHIGFTFCDGLMQGHWGGKCGQSGGLGRTSVF